MSVVFRDGLENVISRGAEYLSFSDLDLIRRAYEFTNASFSSAHLVRYSGEPAIIHPIAVAETLIDWRMDGASVAAAILHDIIEDTPVSAFQLHATFKDEVTFLVEGMTKLRRLDLKGGADRATAYHHHIFLASASDIRVAIIKLADRLHNMRTLQFLPAKKRVRTCLETQKIFIPLSRFMGMKSVKDEYEDISLMFLDENDYERTRESFMMSVRDEEEFFRRAAERIYDRLRAMSIHARVEPCDYNLSHFHDENQNYAASGEKRSGFISVVTRNERDCYAALGAIHSLYEPVKGGFLDTIAFPTADLKRWLESRIHDAGSRFKVRIVSEEMDAVNKLGIIPCLVSPTELEKTDFLQDRLREIQEILHQVKTRNDTSSVEYITSDLFRNEIFVISSASERISLPPDSTVLDFAYRVDEEAANHICGAVVNTRAAGIRQALHSCDKVEIKTDPKVAPTVEWLAYARTPFAKMSIKKSLAGHSAERAKADGKALLSRAVTEIGLIHSGRPGDLENLIRPVAEFIGMKDLDEFLQSIGYGEIPIEDAIGALRTQRKRSAMLSPSEMIPLITAHSAFNREYPATIIITERAQQGIPRPCEICAPVPGDEIELRGSGKRLTLHTTSCRQISSKLFTWAKKIPASWGDTQGHLFPARLRLKLFRQEETYNALRRAINEKGSQLIAMKTGAESPDGLEMLEILIDVPDGAALQSVENAFLSLGGVAVVARI